MSTIVVVHLLITLLCLAATVHGGHEIFVSVSCRLWGQLLAMDSELLTEIPFDFANKIDKKLFLYIDCGSGRLYKMVSP